MINYKTPQKHLLLAIPITILLGIIIGLLFDTTFLKPTITFASIIMIYAMTIGISFKELTQIKNSKVIYYATIFNFIVVPIIAYGIGKVILAEHDMMFAGLLLISAFPTSGMTISWTAMQKGNVSSAIKLTISGLLLGALFAPFYLSNIMGESIDINIINIMSKIVIVVLVPITLGHVTYRLLLKRYTITQFKEQIKPNLSPLSVWAMLYLVFVSISMKANSLLTDPTHLIYSFISTIAFYVVINIITVTIAKFIFKREDAIVFINSIVLRNLSIALGISFTAFGPQAALLITIAYMVQQTSFAFYVKLAETLKERNINIKVRKKLVPITLGLILVIGGTLNIAKTALLPYSQANKLNNSQLLANTVDLKGSQEQSDIGIKQIKLQKPTESVTNSDSQRDSSSLQTTDNQHDNIIDHKKTKEIHTNGNHY